MALGSAFLSRQAKQPALTKGREPVTDQEKSFAGGLNTISADDALGPDQFRRGDNGRLTAYGAFVKRGGMQRTAAALVASTIVQNGYAWYQPSGAVVTMAILGGSLYTTTYGAFPLTWTARGAAASMSTTVTPSLAEFLQLAGTDSVYIADGGLLNRYTGTTLTTNIASTPSCTVLAVHNQRLWGCGDSTFPDSIFYSALNDGDSLGIGASGGGQIVVRTYGDQNVTGLISLGSSLMIFHNKGLSRLTGYGQSDVTVAAAGVSGDVGTTAPFAVVRVGNLAYFVTSQGLYAATEGDVAPVATPERPDPLTAILSLMTSTNIANIRMVLNRATHELLIMVPGYGCYVYHTILKAWSGPWIDGWESPEVNCMFETHNASGYPIILVGDASGFVSETDRPNVFKDAVAADATGGSTYTMALQCRRLYCSDPMVAKAWRWGYLLGNFNGSSSTTFNWTTDSGAGSWVFPPSMALTWGATGTTWGAGTWGAVSQSSQRVQMDNYGYFVDILITDSGAAAPVFSQVRVDGYSLGRR